MPTLRPAHPPRCPYSPKHAQSPRSTDVRAGRTASSRAGALLQCFSAGLECAPTQLAVYPPKLSTSLSSLEATMIVPAPHTRRRSFVLARSGCSSPPCSCIS
ncbi:hypothetical protein BD309DRAFT_945789 [Dichomitus squalens]|uniref:Uncharacterized protein n=1 Tax=Dichomitus squalens TaxID=114155 RepID=A0A4Q9P6Y5_9APHY|nr:hypothetical protein BD309DRAFT_945789 [Dichomitus squalens]TBU65408.1 hypothetical protein BD310DRAFT_7030 [Dichomitus squalens]